MKITIGNHLSGFMIPKKDNVGYAAQTQNATALVWSHGPSWLMIVAHVCKPTPTNIRK
jgi:hypothetical protein